jgi:hypothetical protein
LKPGRSGNGARLLANYQQAIGGRQALALTFDIGRGEHLQWARHIQAHDIRIK